MKPICLRLVYIQALIDSDEASVEETTKRVSGESGSVIWFNSIWFRARRLVRLKLKVKVRSGWVQYYVVLDKKFDLE